MKEIVSKPEKEKNRATCKGCGGECSGGKHRHSTPSFLSPNQFHVPRSSYINNFAKLCFAITSSRDIDTGTGTAKRERERTPHLPTYLPTKGHISFLNQRLI